RVRRRRSGRRLRRGRSRRASPRRAGWSCPSRRRSSRRRGERGWPWRGKEGMRRFAESRPRGAGAGRGIRASSRAREERMAYYLTADGGTESLRARIYDLEGRCLGQRAVPYETRFAPGARAEQDPEDWWRALVAATAGAIAEAGVPAA